MNSNRWMIGFLLLIWCGFTNNFSLMNIAFGLIVSIFSHYLLAPKHRLTYRIRFFPLFSLLFITSYELIKSSIIVAWEVMTPKSTCQPEVIIIDLACQTDIERTLLANIVSLTPGTLTIDLCNNKKQLCLHVMFADEKRRPIGFIKNHLEPLVMKVFGHDPR